jgi:putative hemolysin
MRSLHVHLQHRFPRLAPPAWLRGERARLVRPLLRAFGRWSGLSEAASFLNENGHLRDFDFVRAGLAFLRLDYRLDDAALAAIPATGRLLIVANHPSGALDALALLDAVGRVRRDVRIVANDVLGALTPLAGLMLPVRIFGGRPSPDSVRAVEAALAAEQCVIVFPAGEVSRLGWGGVRDTRWRRGFVRFARRSGAPVLPVRIVARNSALFYGASAIYKPAGTMLLAREMFARREQPMTLHIGRTMRLDPDATPGECMRRVRAAVYALGVGAPAAAKGPEPIALPIDPAQLLLGIAGTELLGQTGDGKEIRLARLDAEAPLLLEIGRLRERTFREVGEGTGRSRDLDDFDRHYEHILVWDAAAGRIAGAYRVVRGASALARDGLSGLYTASLFRYAEEALPRIAEGLELGRSFVAPEYWGSRSLDYLWQGIGAYLRRYPHVRYLFGAVSISAALPLPAREQLVAYYQRYYGSAEGSVASLRPFRYLQAPPNFGDLDAGTAYDLMKANLAAHGATVPVLYKQYTELCEPGGARFLAFGVDPAFSDSIDGLIEVDLHRIQPKKRQRYLQPRAVSAMPST